MSNNEREGGKYNNAYRFYYEGLNEVCRGKVSEFYEGGGKVIIKWDKGRSFLEVEFSEDGVGEYMVYVAPIRHRSVGMLVGNSLPKYVLGYIEKYF